MRDFTVGGDWVPTPTTSQERPMRWHGWKPAHILVHLTICLEDLTATREVLEGPAEHEDDEVRVFDMLVDVRNNTLLQQDLADLNSLNLTKEALSDVRQKAVALYAEKTASSVISRYTHEANRLLLNRRP